MRHSEEVLTLAFVISRRDNVATLLEEAKEGSAIRLLGDIESLTNLITRQDISAAHKVAIAEIEPGEPVIKYGHRIGHATRKIFIGEWVHLHNCASDVDERSNTLDIHTGAPDDSRTAYE